MLSPIFTEYQGKRFVFFSSPHSDNGCLSNWYESGFSLDARDFVSGEQAFLYLKALSSRDEATALRVFAMNDPQYFARLNRQIRPFDARRWAERREAAMRQIVHEKFVQSDELRDFLLATGDAMIVNCSKNPVWSCGLQPTQVDRLDKGRWMGQNLLGQILMDLRLELQPPEPEPEPVVEVTPEPAATPQPERASDVATADKPEPAPQAAAKDATEAPVQTGTTSEVNEAQSAADQPDAHGAETAPSTEADEPQQPSDLPSEEDTHAPQNETEPATAEDEHDEPQDDTAATDGDETVLVSRPEPVDETVILADPQETQLMSKPAETAEAETAPTRTEEPTAPQEESPASEGPAVEGAATLPTSPIQDPSTVVDRYQRGDYPTADELADGSILKGLIQAFSHGDSPTVRQALMQCLRDSVVAVTAVRVDPLIAATAPVREDGRSDPLIMDNGSTYRPSILENDAGHRWFPAFSSQAEISSEISTQTSVIMLPMSKCVDLARTRGDLAGIMVNVFTDNLILPGRTCDYIAGLPSHVGA